MKKNKKFFLWILIMCGFVSAIGCGEKKPMTAEEFAAAVSQPKTVEAYSPAKEPLSPEEFRAVMKKMEYQSFDAEKLMLDNLGIVIGAGPFGEARFFEYEDDKAAEEAYQACLEGFIDSYGKAEKPEFVGTTVKVNETADDHAKLVLQSEQAYIVCSRVENTILYVVIVNDVKKWTKEFETIFEGTGY